MKPIPFAALAAFTLTPGAASCLDARAGHLQMAHIASLPDGRSLVCCEFKPFTLAGRHIEAVRGVSCPETGETLVGRNIAIIPSTTVTCAEVRQ